VLPKVSMPSPVASKALSLAAWGSCSLGGGVKDVIGLYAGVLLKVAVFCSWSVARVGLVGVELWGRPNDDAKGLFEPVGDGLIAIAC